MQRFMTRVVPVLVCCLLVSAVSPNCSAAVGAAMYQAQVPVETQSAEHRQQGAKRGLAEVLIRLSGRSDAVYADSVQQALQVAERYLQSYTYRRESEGALQLQLQFTPELVQNLLRHAELPMWVSGRPTVLLWLALREQNNKQAVMVTPATEPEFSQLVEAEMARRGVPIKWPKAPYALQADELAQLDVDAVRRASQRYSEQVQLAVSLVRSVDQADSESLDDEPTEAQLNGRCIYLDAANVERLRCNRGTAEQLISSAVNSLADILAARFSVQIQGGVSAKLRLEVAGVTDFAAYGRTLNHLKSNALVRDTSVIEVTPGKVVFEVDVQGTQEQFEQALQEQKLLRPLDSGQNFGVLRYEIRGNEQ